MKKQKKNTCEICGKPITVILSGKNDVERLCSRCLVATYPVLKALEKIL